MKVWHRIKRKSIFVIFEKKPRGGYRGSEFSLQISKSTFSSLWVLENCLSSLQWRVVTGCLIPVYRLKIDPFQGYRVQLYNCTGYRFSGKQFPVYKTAAFYSFPGYNFGFSGLWDNNFQIQFTGKSITPPPQDSNHDFFPLAFVHIHWGQFWYLPMKLYLPQTPLQTPPPIYQP